MINKIYDYLRNNHENSTIQNAVPIQMPFVFSYHFRLLLCAAAHVSHSVQLKCLSVRNCAPHLVHRPTRCGLPGIIKKFRLSLCWILVRPCVISSSMVRGRTGNTGASARTPRNTTCCISGSGAWAATPLHMTGI